MTTPTPPPEDLRQLAKDLGVYLPAVGQLDWDRVRSRFLVQLLERLPGVHPTTVAALYRRRLAGDEPSQRESAFASTAAQATAYACFRADAARAADYATSAAVAAVRSADYATERSHQQADLLEALLAEQATTHLEIAQ